MDNLLYNMKLHSELNFDFFKVLRVPGGWLYICGYNQASGVFVPFNHEFQENQPDVELSDRTIFSS